MQNLETAVRKNIEIQQVTVDNVFRNNNASDLSSGEQQYHQDNQVQKREVGENTGVGSIKLSPFSKLEKST